MSRTFILASVAAVLIALTGTADQASAEVPGETILAEKLGVWIGKAGKATHVVLENAGEAGVTEFFKYRERKKNGERSPAAPIDKEVQALRAGAFNQNVIHLESLYGKIKLRTPDGEQTDAGTAASALTAGEPQAPASK